MEGVSSHNGIASPSHNKEHKKRKYVLGPDGKPLKGPDGHRIRVKQEPREQEISSGDAHHTKKHPKVKTEKRHSDVDSTHRNKSVKKEKHGEKRKHSESENGVKDKKKKTDRGDASPTKKVKKEETQEKWKWWEEAGQDKDNTIKWKFLEHKGPVFAPPYEPLPDHVHFKYDGKVMRLQPEAEEVMTFYAKMLEHDYTTKEDFNRNFFGDWRKVMTAEEKAHIKDLGKCNFVAVADYFKMKSEERKARSKEEKQMEKKNNEALIEEYGFCDWDHHKEKIGNFKLEPPGLFRGRGNHPKMGKLKKRLNPEDVIINCSKNSQIPKPPSGHKWKEVRHDNTVTWLVSWTENVQGQNKYIMLNPNSRVKGEKDWQKYETARNLKSKVGKIRENYMRDLKSTEMMVRQRAVALYFIDKLALRAGNEKEDGESADTVGCCSLRCEHIKLHKHLDDKDFVVEFDFLGKDSIRYYNKVPVLKQVFKNLSLFMEDKEGGDDLFDRLNTSTLNKYLNSLMDGLTAKVFRTYNASITLQNQLLELTDPEDENVASRLLSYNRANRAVAILCNHQRAAPKNFSEQMGRMNDKIRKKQDEIQDAKQQVKSAKSDYKHMKTEGKRKLYENKKKRVARLQEQLIKLEVQATDKEENKEIALGTSKLNYLDPRITVAWCKKYEVPVEKVYNKTQRDKFAWAIAMVDETYEF
uniref:DNA topoisomerase I n=1 Tax=Phallusia mammillata TaxID=59560 RepID=A0A6F9DVV5_9ASCI|nr:DNA topoisomerase I, mitochondrial-like [Phallusia mammillata]